MVPNEGSDPHLSPQGISPTPGTEDNAGWQAMQTLPQQTSMSTDYADMTEAPLTDRFNTSGDSDRNYKLSRPTSYILRHLEAGENTLRTPALKGTATRDTKTCVNEDNLESDNLENEIPKRDRTGEHPPPEADDYDEDGSIPWPRDPSPQSHNGDSYWISYEDSKTDSIDWVTRQRQLDDADSRFNPLPWWPVYCANSCCDTDDVATESNAMAREITRSRTVSATSSELSYGSSTGSSDLSKFRHKNH